MLKRYRKDLTNERVIPVVIGALRTKPEIEAGVNIDIEIQLNPC